jgi:hypothetical protein
MHQCSYLKYLASQRPGIWREERGETQVVLVFFRHEVLSPPQRESVETSPPCSTYSNVNRSKEYQHERNSTHLCREKGLSRSPTSGVICIRTQRSTSQTFYIGSHLLIIKESWIAKCFSGWRFSQPWFWRVLSSGIQCCVVRWKSAHVSVENVVSIFIVE